MIQIFDTILVLVSELEVLTVNLMNDPSLIWIGIVNMVSNNSIHFNGSILG